MPQRTTIVLKYNQSNIEQPARCKVKLTYKVARCRFSLVPGNNAALLGMPNIELLDILKIM